MTTTTQCSTTDPGQCPTCELSNAPRAEALMIAPTYVVAYGDSAEEWSRHSSLDEAEAEAEDFAASDHSPKARYSRPRSSGSQRRDTDELARRE